MNQEELSNAYESLKVMYWELKTQQNNKGWRLSIELLKEKLLERDKKIEELEKDCVKYRAKIRELKENQEGVQVVTIDGKSIGAYVTQERYHKVLNQLKEYEQLRKEEI